MSDTLRFEDLFVDVPFAADQIALAGGLLVDNCEIHEATGVMRLVMADPDSRIDGEAAHSLELVIRRHYQLSEVHITFSGRPVLGGSSATTADGKPNRRVLMGNVSKGQPMPIASVYSLGEGKVMVSGEIFNVESRSTKNGDYILCFDISDATSAVRIRRYYNLSGEGYRSRTEVDAVALGGQFKKGMQVTVQGVLKYDKNEELFIQPNSITECEVTYREDGSDEKRVELHLHTQMSAKDATTNVAKLFATLKRWGHPGVAITDHGVLHTFPEVMKQAEKTGVKAIYGVEGYYYDDRVDDGRTYHIILLAENKAGLHNLYQLTSHAHVHDFYRRPRIARSRLTTYRDGLIIGSACEAGELIRGILAGKNQSELLEIAAFYDYLEIQPCSNNAFLLRNGTFQHEKQLPDLNRRVVELARLLDKPVVATGDVHFLNPEDEIFRHILLDSMDYKDCDEPLPLYLRTTAEMLEEFAYLGPETAYEVVVTGPRAILDRCEVLQPVRGGEFFPKLDGSAEELRELCERRVRELYGDNPHTLIRERLETELNSIIGKGYDIIYMTAQKLIQGSIDAGFLVGSRGSVGSSVAAFFAGITEVNSLPPHYRCPICKQVEFAEDLARCGADLPPKDCPNCHQAYSREGFDIPFATFLGFYADKKPDIDLNFASGTDQERAHRQTIELFGEGQVFRCGTIGTIAEKTAIGYALKYLDKRGLPRTQSQLLRLAKGLEGVKQTTGQHPGGLIIVPEGHDINEFCPVQHPADKKDSGFITTHFDYHSIEENLLKLDILGHDDPAMIRMLEELTGVDARTISLSDPDTMSLFSNSTALGYTGDPILGETGACAVPEFGTRFVRGMLLTTRPTTFDELVRIAGLSHGTDVWLGNAEELIRAGTATLGEVICARDDIMNYLIEKGVEKKLAFTIMESVRKGKGLKPEWEADMRANSVPEWYIESCKKIKYMFPKAHAVAYVMMGFRIAWFKVHHPLAFYSAYFTIRAKAVDAFAFSQSIHAMKSQLQALIGGEEARLTPQEKEQLGTLEVCYEFLLRGFHFAPIDLYQSHATDFVRVDGGLRLPLTALPGLGERAAEDFVHARADGPFLSVEQISERARGMNKNHIELLRKSGALDDIPESAQISFFDGF